MLTSWSPGCRPARAAGESAVTLRTLMGPGSIWGMRPSAMMSSASNSVSEGTEMVRVLVRVWPLWVKAMGSGRLRLRADSSKICSQVGLSTRLKRVMVSPAARPS